MLMCLLRSNSGTITTLVRLKIVNQAGYSSREFCLWSEQADHQPAGFGHAEQIARLHPNTRLEKSQHGILVGLESWNAQHGVPTGLHIQSADSGEPGKLAIEFSQIRANPLLNLALNQFSSFEPGREGALHGRIHR